LNRANQYRIPGGVLIAVLLCVLAGCDRPNSGGENGANARPPEATELALVGNDAITVAYLDRAIRGTSKPEQVEYINPPQVRELLETLIDRKLMAEQARIDGFDRPPDLTDSPASLQDDPFQREQRLAQAYLESRIAAAGSVPVADIQAYYDANLEEFTVPERALVTRVVLPTEGAAGHVRAMLAQGLAGETITAQSDGSMQTDVVWLQRRGDPGPMEENVFALRVGEVSDAFPVARGVAVVRVDERVAAKVRPLSEVSAGIAARLGQQRRAAAAGNLRAELRRRAKIFVDEQALGAYRWEE